MKFKLLAVWILSIPSVVSAQGIADPFDALYSSQTNTQTQSSSGGSSAPTFTTVSSTSQDANCLSKDKNVISLHVLRGLLRTKGEDFKIVHSPKTGQIKIKSGPIISNCLSMLEWELVQPSSEFPNYVVQVKIKKPYDCGADKCKYQVASRNPAGEVIQKEVEVLPNVAGFRECLAQSSGLSSSGVDEKLVTTRDLNITLSGAHESAKDVLIANKYPDAKVVYNNVHEEPSKCMFYEQINKDPVKVYSYNDSERNRRDEEAAKICETKNYQKISDFISKYNEYDASLGKIRDELIQNQIKELEKALKEGKDPKDLDLSVIEDFSSYVVTPLVGEINRLYNEMTNLPDGEEKKAKQKEIDQLIVKVKNFRKDPYLTKASLDKLVAKGFFEEAEKLNDYRLVLEHHSSLGKKQNDVLVTPKVAQDRVAGGQTDFTAYLKEKKKEYEVRTGQTTGKSSYYANLAQSYRNNIVRRSENYQQSAQNEILKMTNPAQCPPGAGSLCGYCYKYFRNTAKCLQDAQACIQDLQTKLKQYNDADAAIAADLDATAEKYADWEDEGQRHIARENGEDVDDDTDATPTTPTSAPVEAPTYDNQTGNYNFNYTNPGYVQGAQQPPVSPYQQYTQNPAFPYFNPQQGQGGFNFNFGAGAGAGGPFSPNYYPQQGGFPPQGQNMWGAQSPWGMPPQQFNPYGPSMGQFGSPYQQFPPGMQGMPGMW